MGIFLAAVIFNLELMVKEKSTPIMGFESAGETTGQALEKPEHFFKENI
jgi:hypothetical protein